jgi:hypothetical protein
MYNLWAANGKCPPELMASQSWIKVTHWTGNASIFWNDPANWDNEIPTSAMNVVISGSTANQPVITSSATCNNLIIDADADLIIANGSTLTVAGQVMIRGDLDGAGSISNMKSIQKPELR